MSIDVSDGSCSLKEQSGMENLHDPRGIPMERELFELVVDKSEEGLHLELIGGKLYNMAPPSGRHERMKINLFNVLDRQLPDAGPCFVTTEQYVEKEDVPSTRPDITLSCSQADWDMDQSSEPHRRIISPRLIVEILSPSTENIDRNTKFRRYKRFETLEVYIMVNCRAPAIEVYRRANNWQLQLYISSQIIELEELGLKIVVDDVFRRVQFL
jgi:Uma2 family endonuclease